MPLPPPLMRPKYKDEYPDLVTAKAMPKVKAKGRSGGSTPAPAEDEVSPDTVEVASKAPPPAELMAEPAAEGPPSK